MDVVPKEIRQAGPRTLAIVWSDGRESRYEVRELRLLCPCASCRDEVTGERLLDPARVPQDVHPIRLESVGNYALKVRWSDGHDTGIYTYRRLLDLGMSP
jgi:ATP-binding protein involved in chromosome partitioning